ncbi:thioredoxin family protein [Aureisphaera galaxeae]|uniref:thioredoxin family protein n=1 Tax=Aureisphaera galaxeae TaxID=1538023 RepID=UPI00300FBC2D
MTKTSNKETLVKEHLAKGTSYDTYRTLVEAHVEKGTSTGPEQTESLTQYTLLNHSRMKRLDKTVKIPEAIQQKFENFKGKQTWLVLTESWCGDAAQSMPAMNKLAGFTEHIDFKVLLRDEHLDLMDEFLTNNAMSIPKLIVWDHEKEEVVADWGPRPSIATQMVNDFKEEHGTLTPEFKKDLQVWYNKDKSQNIIEDLSDLIP